MTDKEIIKALELCSGDVFCHKGNGCPYQGVDKCVKVSTHDAIDLINRLKAENERLKTGMKNLVDKKRLYTENMQATREFQIEQAKSEAVKDFAERLCNDRVSNDPVVIAVKAELKEMG